ncbi:transcriptional regulator with XRE-family HTH domain [Ensifer adhaerens]|uniref:Transcriptional regulator with XRE-family HTH domain n=1 Tax=Ensifer adhaerens TaxID=106592 RepID=A0ACC5T0I8_ENSAD|nr:XRE family transcriptional regulator [Ensifer adhaerens]MBP1874373.1 transcriptional regulator with XRE-family HTH domain [Ensifer adhaerens]
MDSQSRPDNPVSELPPLGDRLRQRRKALKLTLKDVADQADFSVGFISQIERGITVPSLTSLVAVCRVLKVEVGTFLNSPKVATPFTRHDQRRAYALAGSVDSNVSYERLSASFPGSVLRSTVVHTPPGHRSEAMTHEGEEIFFILQGALTIEIDGEETVLEAGDSAHFLSGLTHLTWNHTGEPTVILHTCTMDVFGDALSAETPEGAFAVTRADDRRSAAASPDKGTG